jgi:hypothetical protein
LNNHASTGGDRFHYLRNALFAKVYNILCLYSKNRNLVRERYAKFSANFIGCSQIDTMGVASVYSVGQIFGTEAIDLARCALFALNSINNYCLI